MKTQEIDKMIGMPDIDKEWTRFEKEVIDQKARRTLSLSRAAAVAAVAVSIGAAAAVWIGLEFSENSENSENSEISEHSEQLLPAAQPQDADTFLFDNVEMQQIAATLAKHYGVETVFESEEAKHVRLYLQIDKAKSIDEVAELLNNFKKVSVSVRDGKLIIK